MATEKFEVVHDAPMLVGESATWHEVESALYWVDINGLTVNRVHPASGKFTSWKMGSEPSALAVHSDNNLTVATRDGIIHLNTTSGAEAPVADAPYDRSIVRFNDGRVDPAGRFWIGTIYEPRDRPAAEMYVLERGQLRRAWQGGMTNSNGLAWSLDGRTMFHADTSTHRIDCYDYDPATGAQSNGRTFKTFPQDKSAADYGGRPDGATIDSEGAYWVAMHCTQWRDPARARAAGALPDLARLWRHRPAYALHHQRQPWPFARRTGALSAKRQGARGQGRRGRPRRAGIPALKPRRAAPNRRTRWPGSYRLHGSRMHPYVVTRRTFATKSTSENGLVIRCIPVASASSGADSA
jgi:sugar lactone lactonase YvrE